MSWPSPSSMSESMRHVRLWHVYGQEERMECAEDVMWLVRARVDEHHPERETRECAGTVALSTGGEEL